MSQKLSQVHFSSTVKLDVGGQHFTTTVQTLTKDPNSMLAAMFCGKFEMKPSEDGSFFIDRDGTHFRFILNFLRTDKLTLPEGATFTKELEEETEFYQIQGLVDALKPANSTVEARTLGELFAESIILTNVEEQRILRSWLPEAMAGGWRLLFRASRDGYAASVFHSKSDNKGPTVTVVKSRGNILGGFTEESWTNQSGMFFIGFDVPIARHQLRVGFAKDFCIQSNLALRTQQAPNPTIIRTVANSQAKINDINYRRLTDSRYYGLSQKRTLTRDLYSVLYKGSGLYP